MSTREESQMSTISASPPVIRWPRAAIVSVALLVVALIITVALAVSVAGRSTPRTVVHSTPAAPRVYTTHWGHPL
jgi:hypothetical protein